jgi:hypothetical protein
MSKPICQNFTELAAYLRDIDPSAATSIAKSILERVDIPELREFVAPVSAPWEDIMADCRLTERSGEAVAVAVPFTPGDTPFYTPFIVVPNPEWNKESFSLYGNPTHGGGYEVALREGKIMRRKI